MANHWVYTHLTAFSGSTILQFGALDTATEWKPKGNQLPNQLHTWWYVMETPSSAVLGLLLSSKLRIVQLNLVVQFVYRCRTYNPARKPTTEQEKGQCDLIHVWETKCPSQNCMKSKHRQSPSPPLNLWDNLIKAYPNHFKGIGQFPGTYHITSRDDAKPVIMHQGSTYHHASTGMWQAR